MAALFSAPVHAIDWRFEPYVNASATYTDNAVQSESNPEDALILTATPGFTLISEGSRRARASLSYALSGTARFGENENTHVNHNLGATGNAELVEDFLFIDGNARVSQQLISLFGSPAEAEVNDTNRTTVSNYLISPYIQKRFGTFAYGEARYSNSGAIFENDVAPTSNINTVTAKLASGTRFADLFWGLDYSNRNVNNHDDADATFERASATIGYALSRKLRVFGTVGEEWNDYVTSGTSSSIEGTFYSVGFGWSPSRRTSIEASVGERYFGNTYSFTGSYRTRSSRWTARYYEDVADITQQLLEDAGRLFWVCDGNLYETPDYNPPAGQTDCVGPVTSGELASFLNSLGISVADLVALGLVDVSVVKGVYIIKSFNAGVTWNRGRLDIGLSLQDTQRLYEALNQAEDRVQMVTGAVSYRLTHQTTASGSLSFTQNSADALLHGGRARDDDTLTLGLGLNHRFGRDMNGMLTYRHIRRDSSEPGQDYDENRLTATLNVRF